MRRRTKRTVMTMGKEEEEKYEEHKDEDKGV